MNIWQWAGGLITIATYFPLGYQILEKKASQNLFTFILWFFLDLIAAFSIISQKGNFFLPAACAAGSSLIIICIVKAKGRPRWAWFESFVLILVLACTAVWHFSGDKMATVAGTAAMLIAGLPQLADAWKKPEEMPFGAMVSYTAGNTFSVIGGEDWSIKERLFSSACFLYCFTTMIFTARRFWRRLMENTREG